MQALPIAAAGLNDAANRFEASARRTAAAPLDNLVEETVKRVQARAEVQANAAVIRSTDKMIGQVLDTFA